MIDDIDNQALKLAREVAPCLMCHATGRFVSGTKRKIKATCTLCGGTGIKRGVGAIRAIMAAARKEERERCALVCESVATWTADERALLAACACADAIRERPTRSVKLERGKETP